MARATAARRAALRLLGECRRRSARARDLMRASEGLDALEPRDRSLVTRLVLGVTRCSGGLDGVIDGHLRRGMRLEPRLRDALRVAVFELLFLSAPAQAAVSQGVELAREASPRAAGLANAVLRRIAEEDRPRLAEARDRLHAAAAPGGRPVDEGSTPDSLAGDISLGCCLPGWLSRELVSSLGASRAAAVALGSLEPSTPCVAGNLVVQGEGTSRLALEAAGLAPEPLPWPAAFRLGRPSALAGSGLVRTSDVLPADLAAQVVAWLACPRGGRLLEVGQGRGTKSLLLQSAARALDVDLRMACVESDPHKSASSARRLGSVGLAGRASCYALDGRTLSGADESLPEGLRGEFRLAFLDAPCSGSGTLRRHPEVAWSLGEEAALRELPKLQLELLGAVARRVEVGGCLVYSTCSELRQEDEDVVAAFLASDVGREFSLAGPLDAPATGVLAPEQLALARSMLTPEGFLRTSRANRLGSPLCDGHFMARLCRLG